jgi:predicted porin
VKKILVCGALALSPVAAFAQYSAVTMYGIVDTGIVLEGGGPKGWGVNMSSGVQDVSRWGIKGEEALGNGVSAIFKLEDGILVNNGQSDTQNAAFSRVAYVGISSRYGTVTAGLDFTPIYLVLSPLTPFGNAFGGSPGQLMAGEKGGTRAPNQIIYHSPDVYGFKANVAYGLGNVPGSIGDSQQFGFSLSYKIGPATFEWGHQQVNNATSSDSSRNDLITARYNFGFAMAHVGFGISRGMGTNNSRDFLIGLSKRIATVHELYVAYEHKNDLNQHLLNASGLIVDYGYFISKRTNLYLAGFMLSNHRFTTTKFGSGTRELDIGIRHLF